MRNTSKLLALVLCLCCALGVSAQAGAVAASELSGKYGSNLVVALREDVAVPDGAPDVIPATYKRWDVEEISGELLDLHPGAKHERQEYGDGDYEDYWSWNKDGGHLSVDNAGSYSYRQKWTSDLDAFISLCDHVFPAEATANWPDLNFMSRKEAADLAMDAFARASSARLDDRLSVTVAVRAFPADEMNRLAAEDNFFTSEAGKSPFKERDACYVVDGAIRFDGIELISGFYVLDNERYVSGTGFRSYVDARGLLMLSSQEAFYYMADPIPAPGPLIEPAEMLRRYGEELDELLLTVPMEITGLRLCYAPVPKDARGGFCIQPVWLLGWDNPLGGIVWEAHDALTGQRLGRLQ